MPEQLPSDERVAIALTVLMLAGCEPRQYTTEERCWIYHPGAMSVAECMKNDKCSVRSHELETLKYAQREYPQCFPGEVEK